MSKLDFVLEELVTANRILANEGIVDSFGHVSARHPDNPQHYLLSRARAPERIERDDIVEYTLDGTAIDERGRAPYLERFIHGAVFCPLEFCFAELARFVTIASLFQVRRAQKTSDYIASIHLNLPTP